MYNIRDLLGHWVKPRSAKGKMCPHACCRNKRVHPANFPVVLPSKLLRQATDSELANHYGRHASNERVRRQIERELERRDLADRRRQGARERQRSRMYQRQEAIEHAFLDAESATRGNMLNKKGRALGISERSLLTGSEDRARRYASEELLNYWQSHPRPARSTRRGRDQSRVTSYRGLY
jgi:hypothetical protein